MQVVSVYFLALNFSRIDIQKTLFQVLVMDRITKGIKNLPIFNVNATLDQGIKVGDRIIKEQHFIFIDKK